jgi:hypothetical protein
MKLIIAFNNRTSRASWPVENGRNEKMRGRREGGKRRVRSGEIQTLPASPPSRLPVLFPYLPHRSSR